MLDFHAKMSKNLMKLISKIVLDMLCSKKKKSSISFQKV